MRQNPSADVARAHSSLGILTSEILLSERENKLSFFKATGIWGFGFMLLYLTLTDTHFSCWHITPLLEIVNEKLFQHLKTKL